MSPKEERAGQILKKQRTSMRLSLAEVELATRIRGKYLLKIESGDYSGLPNNVYSSGFVRTYADYLGLDGKLLAKKYLAERGGDDKPQIVKTPQPVSGPRFIFTPKIIVAFALTSVVGLVLAYLAWQFSALAAAPKLELATPISDQVIYGSLVDVAGFAGGGADVFVNDSPVLTDGNGNFKDKLALQDGVNSIKVTARNKLGKQTTLTRNILAHLPKLDPSEVNVPAATFDGVAVSVSIKDSATWLVVEVDGKEAFRGTMLPGTSQLFKGTTAIRVTTGNAGVTSLAITNAAVAGKVISPVGGVGEIKRNLEFAKETVIQ